MTRRKTGDFLDELIAERAARNPDFPRRVDAALRRRELLRLLAAQRQQAGLSQAQVARRMRTSQPTIAKIESGAVDVRASTIERFASAIGGRIEYRFVPGRHAGRPAAAASRA